MPETTIVSAYHNYLVEGRLRKDLIAGDPDHPSGFFLVAHQVLPGDPMPLLSGRFFGKTGEFLLSMEKNVLVENPNGLCLLETRGGWTVMDNSLEALLSAEVRSFLNSHLTVLRGVLCDQYGRARVKGDDLGLHLFAHEPLNDFCVRISPSYHRELDPPHLAAYSGNRTG